MALNRWTLGTAGLLALAVMSGWLLYHYDPWWPSDRRPERHDPDYIMDRLSAVRMDERGLPQHRIEAERLVHYPDDLSTELDTVHLTSFAEPAEAWNLYAARARLWDDGSLLLMPGEVVIERRGGPNNRPLKLTTSDLRVVPNSQLAETDQRVLMVSGGDIIESVGMRANFKEDRLELLSKVRATHEPIRR
jgi:lipopolysaccharide export system protein LptC